MMHFARRALVALVLCFTHAGAGPVDQLDPSRIGWESVSFRASKLFFSVDTTVRVDVVDNVVVAGEIVAPGNGTGVTLAERVVRLQLGTDAFGRRNDMTLLTNAMTGTAVQRITLETGNRQRHRIYRFTDLGAWHDTRKPANEAEEALAADQWRQWSNHSTGLYAYPTGAQGEPVIEPAGLLYIVGAARLERPGDYLEMLAYARKRVHRVHIDVGEPVDVPLRYTRIDAGTSTDVDGEQRALRLFIRGEAVGEGDPEDEFELLGLRGRMELLLDPDTRAPLRLTGRAKIVGKVTLRVRELVVGAPE